MKNNNVIAAVVAVLTVLATAILIDLAVDIDFNSALELGLAALVAVVGGVEVHRRLAARDVRRVDNTTVV